VKKWLISSDFLVGDANCIASSKDPVNSSHFFASKTGYNTFRSPMASIALELKYVSRDEFKKLNDLSVEISKLISGLVKTL